MQLGTVFPQQEIGADPRQIRAYVDGVQELEYRHLVASDHVLGADPSAHPGWTGQYTHENPFHEPFVLFAYIAAIAPQLELITSVVVLPQRQTGLVAKQAAELDILTCGRFRLGVGIGWNYVEYEALGMNFKDRARRFEEQIELLRKLTSNPVVTFQGSYERVNAAG